MTDAAAAEFFTSGHSSTGLETTLLKRGKYYFGNQSKQMLLIATKSCNLMTSFSDLKYTLTSFGVES